MSAWVSARLYGAPATRPEPDDRRAPSHGRDAPRRGGCGRRGRRGSGWPGGTRRRRGGRRRDRGRRGRTTRARRRGPRWRRSARRLRRRARAGTGRRPPRRRRAGRHRRTSTATTLAPSTSARLTRASAAAARLASTTSTRRGGVGRRSASAPAKSPTPPYRSTMRAGSDGARAATATVGERGGAVGPGLEEAPAEIAPAATGDLLVEPGPVPAGRARRPPTTVSAGSAGSSTAPRPGSATTSRSPVDAPARTTISPAAGEPAVPEHLVDEGMGDEAAVLVDRDVLVAVVDAEPGAARRRRRRPAPSCGRRWARRSGPGSISGIDAGRAARCAVRASVTMPSLQLALGGEVDVLPAAPAAPGGHVRARWGDPARPGVEHLDGDAAGEAGLLLDDTDAGAVAGHAAPDEHRPARRPGARRRRRRPRCR